MNILDNIQGILFDLDGVLYVDGIPIKDAKETIHYLKSKKIHCRFVTNTTQKSLAQVYQDLQKMDFPIEKEEILSAPFAAVLYLQKLHSAKVYLLLREEVKKDFQQFTITEDNPEVVIIGDIGDLWDYQLLNKVFLMLMNGAELVALHKGKFWQTKTGLSIDIGLFIAGLEYATGKKATIIGKPSPAFFELALNSLALPKENVAMIGDDIDSDVGGSQAFGLMGILAKTGKYRKDFVAKSQIKPDLILESVADLKNYF